MKRALSILVAAGMLACGGNKKPVGTSNDASKVHSPPPPGHPAPPVGSHLVATVTDGTLGPFFARSTDGNGAIAAYASRVPTGGRQIVVAPLDEHAVPHAAPRVVAATAGEVDALVARAVSGGFALAWSAPGEGSGGALRLLEVDAKGMPRSDSFDVARSDKDIVWFEIVPTSRGALCVWAEQASKTDANILALSIDENGRPRGVPSRVVRNVVGWQAVATARGGAVALRNANGGLTIQEIDADAQSLGPPTAVVGKNAGADFDFVRVESAGKKPGFAFAWTDKSQLDSGVVGTWIEDGSPAEPPFAISGDVGGAALGSLTVAGGAAFVMWEEVGRRLTGGRRLHITSIVGRATIKDTALDVHGGSSEVAADGANVAFVGSVRACTSKISDDACAKLTPAPAVVRFDANLQANSIAPITVPEGETAALAWGLECTKLGCAALVASNEAPTPIFVFDASAGTIPSRLLYDTPLPPGAPHVASLSTITAKEPTSDLAEVTIGATTLLATMNGSPDDAHPQTAASSATVAVRAIDDKSTSAPTVLTTRALDLGGVAIAAGDTPDNGALIAWVAKDGGDPQVHAARIDARGKKLHEILVTTERGDAADVAVAWSAGAWLLAWVDWRDGNGEVYVARLAADASRVLGTERITRAPGDASGVALLAPKGGQEAWLAWADPRENPREGFADIYVAKIRSKDAKRIGDETRVLGTAAHSRSPALAALDDGVALAWIEEAPLGEGGNDIHLGTTTASYGAMLTKLDANGHPAAAIRTRGAGEGFPTALTLTSDHGSLRAITARAQEDAVVLDEILLPAGGELRTYALARLEGPPSMDVALALDGNTLFFDDEGNAGQPGDRRVRRLVIEGKK